MKDFLTKLGFTVSEAPKSLHATKWYHNNSVGMKVVVINGEMSAQIVYGTNPNTTADDIFKGIALMGTDSKKILKEIEKNESKNNINESEDHSS